MIFFCGGEKSIMRLLTKNRSPLLRREMKLEKIGGALCDRRGWLEALLLCLWFKTNMYPKFSVEDKKNSSYSKDGAVKSQLSLFIVEFLSCVYSKLFSLYFSVLNFRFIQHVFTNREGQTNCSALVLWPFSLSDHFVSLLSVRGWWVLLPRMGCGCWLTYKLCFEDEKYLGDA